MLFGLLLAVLPAVGILSLIWLVCIYAIVVGALLIVTAFRVRHNEPPGPETPSRVN